MSLPKYIHTASDQFGDIAVIDDGDHRILSFTAGDEQSIQLKEKPYVLQHAYTQAMLLSLLFCQPKRVLILGLGAGTLFTALHHNIAGVRIHGVELRQQVIDIANRYFQLPTSKKMTVSCENALAYLQQPIDKRVDLIMTDLYDGFGMDDVQTSNDYLQLCASRLKAGGWLVLNCWGNKNANLGLFSRLNKVFVDVRSCESGDGNFIVFAGTRKDL